jgi:hypothetical protein
MTLSVSNMNINPMIIRINTVFVIIAMIPRFAHRARLHISHIYTFAGFTLNHKNATRAQTTLIHRVERRNIH